MKVSPSIFREYDIRGIAGKEFSDEALAEYKKWYGEFPGITITPEVAIELGKAYGTRIIKRGGKKVIIGHEERQYGKELKLQFVKGLRETGCDVYDAGIALTPIIYFATAFYNFDGGVNVTGSHNVYFFNGFKMMAKDVNPIFGEEIKLMQKMIEEEDFVLGEQGAYEEKDIFPDYKKYLLEHCKLDRQLKVVVDSGNGSAGIFAPTLLRELGCEVTEMYSEVDATFPNHMPDPEDPWQMRDLSAKVKEVGADIGIALDADGDRFGAVDENGNFVEADLMLIWLAKDVLSRNEGKKILYDVKCTRLLEEYIPKFGGVPFMHKTGHAPIKDTMRKDHDVILSGEISGHFYHSEDYFKIDDGLYSAGKILALLSSSNDLFSSFFNEYRRTVMTPELKLPCNDDIKHRVVEDITKDFQKEYEVNTIDGARIKFSDTSWGLCRASNTSPYLTIRIEADTDEEVIRIKNLLADKLEHYTEIGDKLNRTEVKSHTGKLGWV